MPTPATIQQTVWIRNRSTSAFERPPWLLPIQWYAIATLAPKIHIDANAVWIGRIDVIWIPISLSAVATDGM